MASSMQRISGHTRAFQTSLVPCSGPFSADALVEVWPGEISMVSGIPEEHLRRRMFADLRCSPSCTRAGVHDTVSICPPDCFQYKGTLDVFNKIICQEGFARLWRGTNAGLTLAVPTVGIYLPCYEIFHNWLAGLTTQHASSVTPYVPSFICRLIGMLLSLHNLLPY